MMRCREILDRLEERWNPSFALSWDNVGLLVGKEEKEIGKIFVALDVTEETLEQAVEAGADLMITHHPLLFSPVKKVTSGDIGRRLIKMIQNDLCYYAMHTNFDVKGMAQLNETCLGLLNSRVLEVTGADVSGKEEGIGRVGWLEKKMTLEAFAKKVKEDFQIPDVRVYGEPELLVEQVAVSSGSGKSMIGAALAQQADVLVTGDIDYHSGIDAVAQGLAVVDAGHYGTEYCFIEYMTGELKVMFPRTGNYKRKGAPSLSGIVGTAGKEAAVMEQKMYRVTVGEETETLYYPEGTPYGEIVKDFEHRRRIPVVLVMVGNKLRELHKRLHGDCRLSLITTADDIGNKTYKRSMNLLLLKAVYHVAGHENIKKIVLHFTTGAGFYYTIDGNVQVNEEFLQKVEIYMQQMVEKKDSPL